MNHDVYAEWLVKRKTPASVRVLKVVTAVLAAVSVVLAIMLPFGMLILLLCGGLCYLVFRNGAVEFEYLYVTGILSVDKIMGQSKRKQIWESSMEEIQMIAPEGSGELKSLEKPGMKVLDFTSRVPGKKVYAVISQNKGELTKVLIEPNDQMIQCFWQTAPRKVMK